MEDLNKLKTKKKFFDNHPFLSCYSIFALIVILVLVIVLITNLNLFNLISISLGTGVFVSTWLVIYYVENRLYKKDLSMSTTQYISGQIEITESVKGLRFALIPILIIFLSIMIFASIGMLITIGGLNAFLALIIIWIIIGLFIIPIFKKILPGTSKLRKFVISDSFIQILVPPKPIFQVNWSDFDLIELKILSIHNKKGVKMYELIFIGEDFQQSFKILYGKDFYRKFFEIIELLQECAHKKKKKFLVI